MNFSRTDLDEKEDIIGDQSNVSSSFSCEKVTVSNDILVILDKSRPSCFLSSAGNRWDTVSFENIPFYETDFKKSLT